MGLTLTSGMEAAGSCAAPLQLQTQQRRPAADGGAAAVDALSLLLGPGERGGSCCSDHERLQGRAADSPQSLLRLGSVAAPEPSPPSHPQGKMSPCLLSLLSLLSVLDPG